MYRPTGVSGLGMLLARFSPCGGGEEGRPGNKAVLQIGCMLEWGSPRSQALSLFPMHVQRK